VTTPLVDGQMTTGLTGQTGSMFAQLCLVADHTVTWTIELGPFCDMVSLVTLDHVFSSDIGDDGL